MRIQKGVLLLKKLFKFMLLITTLILIITVIKFYPDSNDDMFPLFTDMTTLFIFLPAYFLIFIGILPLFIFGLIKNKIVAAFSILVTVLIAFIKSFGYLSFYSIEMRIVFNLFAIIPTLVFWLIVIYSKALFNFKKKETTIKIQ